MNLIWKYLRPHWKLACLAPLCVLLEVWAELEQPDLMAVIVDRGILGGEPDVVTPTGIKMVVIMLIGVVGGILSIYAAGRVTYRFGADLRSDLYSRISRFSFSDVDRLEAPSLITRMGDDVNRVQQVIQASMRLLFRAPFMFVGAVVMSFMIDTNVSVVLLALMLCSFVFVIRIMRSSLPLFVDQQRKRDGFVSVVQEILVGVRVTKAYTNEDVENRKFNSVNANLLDSTIKVSRHMSFMMPFVSFALNAGIIAVIYFGAGEIEADRMKVGGIMATINYLAQIQMALMMASHVILSITQAEASVDRLREVLDTPTEAESDERLRDGSTPLPYSPGDVVFDNVSFSYDGNRHQLDGVSFNLHHGETLAILGETGSGKTTLVNLIPRYYDPSSGSISIDGKPLTSIDRRELQAKVAMVMQHSLLFSGTIRDNMRMGKPDATDDEIMAACDAAQMGDHIRGLADGLDHLLDQGATNLSGGQKQRLCIARTLLTRPDVLILDDSFCSLDLLTEKKIKTELDKLTMTKIIVAQRISSIRNANQILMLRNGQVEACGTHDELMNSCETYRETFRAQTGLSDSNSGKEALS